MMNRRCWLAIAAFGASAACTKRARADRMMTWSEESSFHGAPLPEGEHVIVLRFVDDPGQGLTEDWTPALRDRLRKLGNPVQVTFDCWRQWGGVLGFNIVAIGGEPFTPAAIAGPSRAGSFSEGAGRPHPLESPVE